MLLACLPLQHQLAWTGCALGGVIDSVFDNLLDDLQRASAAEDHDHRAS